MSPPGPERTTPGYAHGRLSTSRAGSPLQRGTKEGGRGFVVLPLPRGSAGLLDRSLVPDLLRDGLPIDADRALPRAHAEPAAPITGGPVEFVNLRSTVTANGIVRSILRDAGRAQRAGLGGPWDPPSIETEGVRRRAARERDPARRPRHGKDGDGGRYRPFSGAGEETDPRETSAQRIRSTRPMSPGPFVHEVFILGILLPKPAARLRTSRRAPNKHHERE